MAFRTAGLPSEPTFAAMDCAQVPNGTPRILPQRNYEYVCLGGSRFVGQSRTRSSGKTSRPTRADNACLPAPMAAALPHPILCSRPSKLLAEDADAPEGQDREGPVALVACPVPLCSGAQERAPTAHLNTLA